MPHSDRYQQLCEQARQRPPRLALVLGSGLGELAERAEVWAAVAFADVPGLEAPSVPGHRGLLMLARWAGQDVLIFSGRLHFYEGLPTSSVVRPVHIAHSLGVRALLLTNSAGGIRDDLVPGSLLAVTRHVEWNTPASCRKTSTPYDRFLLDTLSVAAREIGIALSEGVYAQVSGPCYETPAEIRALQSLGVDAVGMSTTREAETAQELGLTCLAVSCITNRAAGLAPGRIHHEEVLACTAQSKERFGDLLERFLNSFEYR